MQHHHQRDAEHRCPDPHARGVGGVHPIDGLIKPAHQLGHEILARPGHERLKNGLTGALAARPPGVLQFQFRNARADLQQQGLGIGQVQLGQHRLDLGTGVLHRLQLIGLVILRHEIQQQPHEFLALHHPAARTRRFLVARLCPHDPTGHTTARRRQQRITQNMIDNHPRVAFQPGQHAHHQIGQAALQRLALQIAHVDRHGLHHRCHRQADDQHGESEPDHHIKIMQHDHAPEATPA